MKDQNVTSLSEALIERVGIVIETESHVSLLGWIVSVVYTKIRRTDELNIYVIDHDLLTQL